LLIIEKLIVTEILNH